MIVSPSLGFSELGEVYRFSVGHRIRLTENKCHIIIRSIDAWSGT